MLIHFLVNIQLFIVYKIMGASNQYGQGVQMDNQFI